MTAIRLAMAPDRKVVSRDAVVSTRRACSVMGESRTLVMAMVVAPLASATRSASTVSVVVPVWEIAMATSPGPSSAAEVSAACGSGETDERSPMRCSFWWRSWATKPLAPTP